MFSSSKAGRGARLSLRSPQVRVVAGAVVAAVAVSSFAFGGTNAGAATLPNAQSVGRFLDGSIAGKPIESIANITDARSVNPGTTSVQNPLTVTVLNQIKLPLNGALQLPPLLGIQNFGVANQVATTHADGYSYGASGAVNNSGGVSVGGNNSAYPANGTLALTGAGISGNPAASVLGGLSVNIGAVSALASTPAGVGKPGSTSYQIAGLNLQLGSPLVGKLISPVVTALGALLNKLSTSASLPGLPPSCALASTTIPDLVIDNGAVVISTTNGGVTIDLAKVLASLNLNINQLPANTDLVADLLNYITNPALLAAGLTNTINNLIGPLQTQFQSCLTALGPLGGLLATLLNTLTGLKTTLETSVSTLLGKLASSLPNNPLKPLADVLAKVIDIGINVQPNGAAGTYTDALAATPDQATAVVPNQTVVRAIEVNLLSGKLASLALANAAAGPSAPASTVTTPPASSTPASNVPTGVPAGDGTKGGMPTLPIVLLIVGLLTAASGVTAQRLRLRRNH